MSDQNTFPAWHFNFRNKQKLPDVKDIKKADRIRAIACLVVVLILGYVGFIEFQAFQWKMKVNSLKAQVENKKPLNNEYISLNKKFVEYTNIVKALDRLSVPSINPIDVLLKISAQRPLNLVFNTISMIEEEVVKKDDLTRDYMVTLNGFVKGGDDKGLSSMDAFENALNQDVFFKKSMQSFKVKSLERAEEVGMLNFIINIKLKGAQ